MDGDEPSTRGLHRRDVLRVGVAAVGGGIVTSATAWAAPRGPGRSSSDGAEALNTALRSDLPQRLGIGRVIWSVPTTLPLVAVTFDDGPDPRFTPRVLDALAAASVTATFNVMGHNAVAHPALLRRAVIRSQARHPPGRLATAADGDCALMAGAGRRATP